MNHDGQYTDAYAGISLGTYPANESRLYNVTTPLIGWAPTWTNPVLSLLEAPGAKTLPKALLFRAICASYGRL